MKVMNLQEIINPIGKFMEETFELLLVPMSAPFNVAVVVLALVSLVVWLRTMKRDKETV